MSEYKEFGILKPGEKVFIGLGKPVSQEEFDKIKKVLEEEFPDNKFVILTGVESVKVERND